MKWNIKTLVLILLKKLTEEVSEYAKVEVPPKGEGKANYDDFSTSIRKIVYISLLVLSNFICL